MGMGCLRIFFDGDYRPNPNKIKIATIARNTAYPRLDVGHGSGEEAEWLALLHAVEIAVMLGGTDVELVGDSRSVIDQASGTGKCRDVRMQQHLAAYRAAISAIPRVRLRHVLRSKNLAGIALAKGHPR